MTSQLKQIDQQAEILASLYDNGRITEAEYIKDVKKLTDRAERILAKLAR